MTPSFTLPQGAPSTLVMLPAFETAPTIHEDSHRRSTASSGVPSGPVVTLPIEATFKERYSIEAQLGQGGMGVVSLASDRRVGRQIAVKTMRSSFGGSDIAARFLREACIQGQLEHPAILPVYDLGRDVDGLLYFSMRRIRGVTLEEIIARLRARDPEIERHYSRRRLLAAFASVCQAVHFAHTRGVVHRDVKPANVMLGDFGEVYVLDWGIAKLVGVPDPVSASERVSITPAGAPHAHTDAGALLGTLGYMAPEQAENAAAVDGRADVYALGAILFELLCFLPLHPASSMGAALASTMRGADARISVRAPSSDVPPELDAICVRATQVDREKRFQSVGDLLDALERFLDGDRDLERRRELSRTHTREAATAAEAALGTGEETTGSRRRALGEVGRALALDPSNAEAAALLVRLMTEPPREMPAEAALALRASTEDARRATARGALVGYLAWFLFLPFGSWMGVRSYTAAIVTSVLWLLAALSAFYVLRKPRRGSFIRWMAIVLTASAACGTSVVGGPYVLVPTIAVINVMLWLLLSGRAERWAIVGLGGLAIVVPAALEWAGVLHFYNFRDGRVTILQGMLDFHPVPTHAFLLATSLALVAVAALLVARFKDHLADAERTLHLQAWQLRQLLPDK